MNGSEALALSAVVTALIGLVPLVKFWMDLGAMRAKAINSESLAHTAIASAQLTSSQFAQYRAEVAEKYATISALGNAEMRFTSAVEGMRSDLHRMTDRLDRVLEINQRQQ